ncbi:MAG: hypothetical protein AAFZ18_04660 [Myxococcota bacterium]
MAVACSSLAEARAAEGAPDVVRLKDGSFVRGTIVEQVVGSHVVVQTVTGEIRTIPSERVVAAGPVELEGKIQREPGSTRTRSGGVNLRFEAPAEQKLTAHRLAGSSVGTVWTYGGVGVARVDSFNPLCMAPCSVEIPKGTYQFGISERSGNAQRARGGPFNFTEDETLRLEFASRRGARITGWVVFGASAVAALAIIASPLFADDITEEDIWVPAGIGLGTLGAGIAVGLPLMLLRDHAEVTRLR